MTLKKAFLILPLFFVGFIAQSQTAQDFKPTHLIAAENMLKATGIDTNMEAIFDNVIDVYSANVPEVNRKKFQEVMKDFLQKYMNWESLKEDMAIIYAAEFSESELMQLTEFYNTPLGKKTNAKMPVLQQKGMLLGQQRVIAHQDELQQKLKENFEKP